MDFPEWFQRELDARGMGVREFAAVAGASRQVAYLWRSGEVTPDPKSCAKIARAFGYEGDYVLERAGHRTSEAEAQAPHDPQLVSLVQIVEGGWERMSAESRALTDNVIRGLFGPHLAAPGEHRRKGGKPTSEPLISTKESSGRKVAHVLVSNHAHLPAGRRLLVPTG